MSDGKTRALYVQGLGQVATEQQIHEEFSKHGTVEKVVLVKDKETRELRGFGYIYCTTNEDATNCLNEMDGRVINDMPIKVKYSNTEIPEWVQKARENGGFAPPRGSPRGRGPPRGRGGFAPRGGFVPRGRGGRGGDRGGRGGMMQRGGRGGGGTMSRGGRGGGFGSPRGGAPPRGGRGGAPRGNDRGGRGGYERGRGGRGRGGPPSLRSERMIPDRDDAPMLPPSAFGDRRRPAPRDDMEPPSKFARDPYDERRPYEAAPRSRLDDGYQPRTQDPYREEDPYARDSYAPAASDPYARSSYPPASSAARDPYRDSYEQPRYDDRPARDPYSRDPYPAPASRYDDGYEKRDVYASYPAERSAPRYPAAGGRDSYAAGGY